MQREDEWESRPNGYQRGREDHERIDNNIRSIKMKIPTFYGKNDPDVYLEWEREVELIFECHNYTEDKKVKLAAVQFKDYAIVWWDQVQAKKRRNGLRPIRTWEEMKELLRDRFVPPHYISELHQRLQRWTQGSKSVEDYHKAMEIAMIRASIEESVEATMARFHSGLNAKIANIVELHHYDTLNELVQMV
ncbi:uncharacterized protein LOC131172996 [Hevea brasiliensis]|uniref:uncharacterized protein LOC131172996 n=1 Tax=Hevea brasiliensis TaxID=3981 RepID=UPI0025F3089A|nr:uncharacterized protein LOC131172996 [Hevea brasiliensis]